MQQSIDIMQRVDADRQNQQTEPLQGDEVSEIGDYALALLDELSVIAANRGLQQTMRVLQRLSLPAAEWIGQFADQGQQGADRRPDPAVDPAHGGDFHRLSRPPEKLIGSHLGIGYAGSGRKGEMT